MLTKAEKFESREIVENITNIEESIVQTHIVHNNSIFNEQEKNTDTVKTLF